MRQAAFYWVLLGFTCFGATPAIAQGAEPEPEPPITYNCDEMYSTEANASYNLDPALIEYCVRRGWDTPGAERPSRYNWQPAGGKPVRTGTAGSTQISGKQSPSNPPGVSNSSRRSGSNASIGASNDLPNADTSQCFTLLGQTVCESCTVSNGISTCTVPILNPDTGEIERVPAGTAAASVPRIPNPVGGDLAGRFGRISRMRGGQKQFTCGATMTLGKLEVAGVLNAQYLVIAKDLDRELEIFRRDGNSFFFLHKVKLDKNLCDVDGDDKVRLIEQFVFFNANQPFVVLRVIQPPREGEDEEQEDGEIPPYNAVGDEKYVTIPPGGLINGSHDKRCEKFELYPESVADLRMIPQVTSEDETIQLPLNTAACADRVLHLDLTTPNLVHQPGSVVSMFNIEGHNEIAVNSTQISILASQPDSLFRLGIPGAPYIFTDHIVMDLSEGQSLHMYGPTTFIGGASAIKLDGGGHVEDNEGEIIQRIPAGSSYTPFDLTPPYYVVGNEKVYIPANVTLISTPAGIIREPTDPPPTP
jgi:hypothetical protein